MNSRLGAGGHETRRRGFPPLRDLWMSTQVDIVAERPQRRGFNRQPRF